jgi:hypothetical protein
MLVMKFLPFPVGLNPRPVLQDSFLLGETLLARGIQMVDRTCGFEFPFAATA